MVFFAGQDEKKLRKAWNESPLEGILQFYELERTKQLREKTRKKWTPKIDLAYQVLIEEDHDTQLILGQRPPLTDVESDTLTALLGDQTKRVLSILAEDAIEIKNTKLAYLHAEELAKAAPYTANIYDSFHGGLLEEGLRLARQNAADRRVATYVGGRKGLWKESYKAKRDKAFPLGTNFKVVDDRQRPRVLVRSISNRKSLGSYSNEYEIKLKNGLVVYYQSEIDEKTVREEDATVRIQVINAIGEAFERNQRDNSYDPNRFQPLRVGDSLSERVNRLS